MGKPTGQYPFPITYSENPKRDQKLGRASTISVCLVLHLRQAVEVPKMVKYYLVLPKLGQGPTVPDPP
jgi:hypothetical protein